MDDQIKKFHKIVYRAMEYQYLNFDILQKLDNLMAYTTVTLSIISLVGDQLKDYLVSFGMEILILNFIFFLINIFTVISSLCWLILTNKYNKTLIGLRAEEYKNIQYKISCSVSFEKAEEHFKEYLKIKPPIADLFITWTWLVNKRLKRCGKSDYSY